MKHWAITDHCEVKSALPYYGTQQAELGRDKLNGEAHKCVCESENTAGQQMASWKQQEALNQRDHVSGRNYLLP